MGRTLRERVQVVVEIGSDKARKELNDLENEASGIRDRLKDMKRNTKEYVAESRKLEDVNNKIDKLRKNMGVAAMPIKTLQYQTKKLRAELRQLTPGTEAFIRKSKELRKVEDRLREVTRGARTSSHAMKQAAANAKMFATAFVAYQLVSRLQEAWQTMVQFEQANANLASILGETRKEINGLTQDAKRLGSQTSFTASDVTKLQTEYAKLGFTKSEILNVSEATLQLAAAAGEELAPSAEVVGAPLRQFNMDSTQTQRVVDVMAKSFTSSALNMERFSVAMRYVGPVAKRTAKPLTCSGKPRLRLPSSWRRMLTLRENWSRNSTKLEALPRLWQTPNSIPSRGKSKYSILHGKGLCCTSKMATASWLRQPVGQSAS